MKFRFALVGGMNFLIDMFVFNDLLFVFPAKSVLFIVLYSIISWLCGATNSYFWNKYWTFSSRSNCNRKEVTKFLITSLCSLALSTGIIWFLTIVLHPFIGNGILLADTAKVFAVAGSAVVSYIGMRKWVFV